MCREPLGDLPAEPAQATGNEIGTRRIDVEGSHPGPFRRPNEVERVALTVAEGNLLVSALARDRQTELPRLGLDRRVRIQIDETAEMRWVFLGKHAPEPPKHRGSETRQRIVSANRL